MSKDKLKKHFFAVCAFIFLVLTTLSAAQDQVTVGNVYPGEVDFKGFSLSTGQEITITGNAGSFGEWNDNLIFYGWILNSDTRKIEWHLMEDLRDDLDRDRGGFVEFEEKISLPAGSYEVYFTGMYDYHENVSNVGDFFDRIFGGNNKRRFRRSYTDELFLTVSGSLKPNMGTEKVDEIRDKAIVAFVRVGDDEYLRKGFTLSSETKLKIYSVGEGRRESLYDHGWIVNLKTHERVWDMDGRFSDYAGGGEKNIMEEETITLPAGSYMAYYVSDDSHSFEEWNVLPPDDPQFWGLTVSPASESDRKKVVPFKEVETAKPVIEITRVFDDEYRSQGFKLSDKTKLRILCLGEESYSGGMADYGWIINADTRETVWEMQTRKSEHAGGADKNRMVSDELTLPKGNYIAFYSSDDSHSYESWNASPPYDRESWGISIWVENENDKKYISFFDEKDYRSDDVLAQIVRVRDDDFKRESFTLDKITKVKIIAIGEGDRSEMYDFGWIENDDTRDIVWEMTYRKTEDAGGARKNRMFNGTILLEPGNYTVFYETDGSHSYRDWNDTPPHDAERYGITIIIEK